MRTIREWKKVVVILMAVGFVFSQMLSSALAADAKAEKMVMKGTDMMMKGKKDLMAGLGKQKLTKDPKLMTEINKLNEGEKGVVAGNKLIKKEKERTKGKEMIMSGTTMMMEAKDAIMAELKSRGMLQEGKLKEGEKLMVQGDNKMLEGKNGMMDGFKKWE
jgi:hypothetical protein